ncbi:MAG: hypothetical protein JWL66_1220 [Sphingomonadales bacterium]|nr:hypothetical protein [Sphingomonadales bacterium]
MTQGVGEQGETFDIAVISGVGVGGMGKAKASRVKDPYGFWASQELTLTWADDRAIISAPRWDRATWDRRLALMLGTLAILSSISDSAGSTLRWLFSGKKVTRTDAEDMLAIWLREFAPPVMDIIEFQVEQQEGQRFLRTIGLFAIVDHEIEAIVGEDDGELARMVGHLAQEVLRTGPVKTDSVTGPDGGKFRLNDLADTSGACQMIRITPEYT